LSAAFPKWESGKNKIRNSGVFFELEKRPSTYHGLPAIHHKFTSKKPRKNAPFLPKPPAKTGISFRNKKLLLFGVLVSSGGMILPVTRPYFVRVLCLSGRRT
jgi:hypothetical protein